jgi:cytoskeleton protein RodZ
MSQQQELIPMRLGDLLRHAREQKKLSLERAAEQCRIRLATLRAIESGDTSAIPTIYLRGYVRNYARFLGVDSAEIESRMDVIEGAEPDVRTVFPDQAPRRGSERWLKVSSYVAASALIVTLTWQFTHEAVKWSQGEGPGQAPVTTGPAAAETVTPAAERNRHLSASIASVEMLGSQGGLDGARGAAAEEAWAAIDASRPPGAADGRRMLEISTSADTWVEIFGAGERQLEMDLIRAGSRREYADQGPFRIMVGRASAVLVALDGEPVDLAPHTRDGVARLTVGAPATGDDLADAPQSGQ